MFAAPAVPQFDPSPPSVCDRTVPFSGWVAGLGRVIATPAKINFFLEITSKRSDGYHDIATLMAPINLFDTLEVQPNSSGEITLTCDDARLPCGPTNLVHKAATALKQASGTALGARIHLSKRIPSEAGLGGGSSDAAATLAALNAVWKLFWPLEQLSTAAAKIGSDVAFFLHGSAAWCTGRGEIIEPIPTDATFHLVLVKPAVGLSTPEVYKRVSVPSTPQSGIGAQSAFRSGNAKLLAREMFNRLQAPAFGLQPSVSTLYDQISSCGPLACLLSGSGSSLFALCEDAAHATRVARTFRESFPDTPHYVAVVHTLGATSE